MMPPAHIHPHDIGLPAPIVRQRRHAHRIARFMLLIAGLTALAGWLIFGSSIFYAWKIRPESPYRAIIAYALLIVSSVSLILGLWYLLVAQVDRIARIVDLDADDLAESPTSTRTTQCPNCGWPHDAPDRFCRHCGKPLGTNISAASPR